MLPLYPACLREAASAQTGEAPASPKQSASFGLRTPQYVLHHIWLRLCCSI